MVFATISWGFVSWREQESRYLESTRDRLQTQLKFLYGPLHANSQGIPKLVSFNSKFEEPWFFVWFNLRTKASTVHESLKGLFIDVTLNPFNEDMVYLYKKKLLKYVTVWTNMD